MISQNQLGKLGLSILTLLFSSCAPTPSEVTQEWLNQGWTLVKVHGEEGPIQRHGKLQSRQAQAVEASWIQRGKRKTQVYPQDRNWILVLRFFKKDGDEFAVVLKKKK